jgi:hypothetical protein
MSTARVSASPRLWAMFALAVSCLSGTGWAQPNLPPVQEGAPELAPSTALPAVTDPDRLRFRIEEHWRVVPLQEGLLLVPRRPGQDVRGVEIRGDGIAIDGRAVSGAELRQRLGADADAVLALSYQPSDRRRELFFPTTAPTRPDTARVEPAAPETAVDRRAVRRQGTRFRLGSDVVVREHERVGEAVAVFGSVNVDGQVDRDVVAVFGSVTLGPRASVRGDVTAVGGTIVTDPGAQLHGRTTEVGLTIPPLRWPDVAGWRITTRAEDWAGFAAAVTLTRMAVLAVLAVLILAVARDRVQRIAQAVSDGFWLALVVGLALQVLLFPVLFGLTAALIVSVIGIPLLALLPLLVLAFGAVWLAGFVAAAHAAGSAVLRRSETGVSMLALILGLAFVWVVTLVARAWWWNTGDLTPAVVLLSLLGLVIEGAVWSAGLGAVFLTWVSPASRREVETRPVVPPPPAAPARL